MAAICEYGSSARIPAAAAAAAAAADHLWGARERLRTAPAHSISCNAHEPDREQRGAAAVDRVSSPRPYSAGAAMGCRFHGASAGAGGGGGGFNVAEEPWVGATDDVGVSGGDKGTAACEQWGGGRYGVVGGACGFGVVEDAGQYGVAAERERVVSEMLQRNAALLQRL